MELQQKKVRLVLLITPMYFVMSSFIFGNCVVLTTALSICIVLSSSIAVAIEGNEGLDLFSENHPTIAVKVI